MNPFMSNNDQPDDNLFQESCTEQDKMYDRRAFLNAPSFRSVINHDKEEHERDFFLTKINQQQQQKRKKRTREKFPLKVHNMLEDAEKESNQHIIGWEPDGLSFKIHMIKEFEKTILPRYFNHSNFRSFQRQLYHYQFTRKTIGRACGAYFHPQFKQYDKSRCPQFAAKKVRSDPESDIKNHINTDRAEQNSCKEPEDTNNRDQQLPKQNRVAHRSKSSSEEEEDINMIAPASLDNTGLHTIPTSDMFRTTNDNNRPIASMNEEAMYDKQSLEMADMEPFPLGQRGDLRSPEMKDLLKTLFRKQIDMTASTDVASAIPDDSNFDPSSTCHFDSEPIPLAQIHSKNSIHKKCPPRK